MAYLAEQTGGFAVLNTNDLARGLGRITSDLRGYYVIGYVPEDGTFAAKGKTARFHKIAITVKRAGLRVKTRKEFLGISDPQETAGPTTAAEQLVHAAISPFAATDIALRATALPAFLPDQGMFVRALLHIDARALKFVDSEGARKTASVDVLGMVFNQEGAEVGHLSTGFAVALTAEAESDALRDGLAYNLRIPIPRPGGYQVRFAVRDQQSGAMGSAGEFVDVDDMTGGAFALSGIVLRSGDRTARQAVGDADEIALTPAQALRVYRPGTRLSVRLRDLQREHDGRRRGNNLPRHREGVRGGPQHPGASARRRQEVCRRRRPQPRRRAAARQLQAGRVGHDAGCEPEGPNPSRGAADRLRCRGGQVEIAGCTMPPLSGAASRHGRSPLGRAHARRRCQFVRVPKSLCDFTPVRRAVEVDADPSTRTDVRRREVAIR